MGRGGERGDGSGAGARDKEAVAVETRHGQTWVTRAGSTINPNLKGTFNERVNVYFALCCNICNMFTCLRHNFHFCKLPTLLHYLRRLYGTILSVSVAAALIVTVWVLRVEGMPVTRWFPTTVVPVATPLAWRTPLGRTGTWTARPCRSGSRPSRCHRSLSRRSQSKRAADSSKVRVVAGWTVI